MGKRIGIRGAGVAGLSLARAIVKRTPGCEIVLFDTRDEFPTPQRTFCFFSDNSLGTDHTSLDFQWKKIKFKSDSLERIINVEQSPYTLISGETFFAASKQELSAAGVEFRWSCAFVEIKDHSIHTESGAYEFDQVFDAAFNPSTANSLMWQSFGGIWIKTQDDIFDPSTAILMELVESTENSPLNFFYILPTSTREALIEHTSFAPSKFNDDWHFEQVNSWLKKNVVVEFEVTNKEYGVIPMGLSFKPSNEPITVGSYSGAIRPSTGYAYINIQAQARQLALALSEGDQSKPALPIIPSWLRWCDTLFLKALLANPKNGRNLMSSLLFKAPADALPPFLNGRMTLLQGFRVMSCAPKLPMVRALVNL
jgi:lycopene beta-cyclase